MARWVPFTAYFKVIPHRGQLTDSTSSGVVVGQRGGRFDYVRSLQKLAVAAYEELYSADDNLKIARNAQNDMRYMMASLENAVGVVPQFGNKPSLLSFEGFLEADGAREDHAKPASSGVQVASRVTRISNDRVYQGYSGEQPWLGTSGSATSDVLLEVRLLMDIMEAALTDVFDVSGNNPRLWKLRYNGIEYGVGGHHLPLAS